MPHNGHTWGDICGADIGGVCRWGSWAVACKAGGVCRKGCVCRKGPWYSPLPLYTCNQKGQQHYHSLIPDADMDVITELRQSKELSGIQHTPKPNPNPTPFHNPYSIECAVNMRTWRKMNSEVDTCTAWVPVDRKRKHWSWEIVWRSMPQSSAALALSIISSLLEWPLSPCFTSYR